jgi:uncharacterized protein YbjT (DUF2867 family)
MEAILLGASGLIGGELLKLLLADPNYSKVKIIVRKKLPVTNEKLEQIIADFSTIEAHKKKLKADVVFSCLGSTKKKTPNLKEYYQIDHDYPVLVGKLAKDQGVKSFHIVSSLGANSSSSGFYLRMKGETEDDIEKIGFKSYHIYRPSLLTGDRKEKRIVDNIGEVIMKIIDPLLLGSFKKYRSISGKTVASAMHKQSLINSTGKFVYPSDKIKELA